MIASYITFRVSIALPYMYYEAMTKTDIRLFKNLGDMQFKKRKYRNMKPPNRYNRPVIWLIQKWTLFFSKLFYVSFFYYIMPFMVLCSPMWVLAN